MPMIAVYLTTLAILCTSITQSAEDAAQSNGNEVVKKDQELDCGFARVIAVELYYKNKPDLKKSALLKELRTLLPDIAPLDGKEDSDLCAFMHTKHKLKYKDDAEMPAQCLIALADKAPDLKKLETAIQQSWSFKDCRATVEKCKYSVIVTDFVASGLEYKVRMDLFHKVLRATLKAVPPDAIYWQCSQQFINPESYLKQFEKPDPMAGFSAAVNVRFYRISNSGTGDMVADTLGLGALGLDDLQCHFRNLNPDDVVKVLYNTAYYLYEKGPVIKSGHTIQGVTSDQKWKCQNEKSLVEPKRILLDVNPGGANAAGDRK
jgi:hypothetical protein